MNQKIKMLLVIGMMIGSPIKLAKFRAPGQLPAIFSPKRGGNGAGAELERLTVKALRKMASGLKIAGRSKARRKADLVKIIRAVGK